MSLDRRTLFKTGLAGLPLCGLSRSLQAMASSAASLPAFANRRLLTIFLRGGNDGLNTVIPFADPDYISRRPNIYYDDPASTAPRKALSFPGYGKVGIHPELAPVLETTLSAIGNRVAFLHRVGNFAGQRSHFTEMHIVETGQPTYTATAEGWLPQLLPALATSAVIPSVSESDRLMRMYLSGTPGQAPAHIQKAYATATAPPNSQRVLSIPFADPATPSLRVADKVRAVAQSDTYQVVGSGDYLRNTTIDAIDDLATLRASLGSFPHDGAKFPSIGSDPSYNPKYALFFERLEEAVQLLRGGFSNFAGVELGGWDTHNSQLSEHAEVLNVLGRALRGAHDGLATGTDDFLIMVVSEFGRTVADNGNSSGGSGNAGTDHGVGGVCIAVGTKVRSGIYNCSGNGWIQLVGTPSGVAPWMLLANTPSTGPYANALVPVTDFRVPFIEVAKTFFGLTDTQISAFPGIGSDWLNIIQNLTNLDRFKMLDYLLP